MAGELKIAQLTSSSFLDPAHLSRSNANYSSGVLAYCTYHSVPAGATGNPDDVVLINATMPVKSVCLFSILFATAGAGGASAQLRNAAGGVGDPLSGSHPATAAMNSGRQQAAGNVNRGGSVYLRRSNDNIGGTMLIFWGVYATVPTASQIVAGSCVEQQILQSAFISPAKLVGVGVATAGTPFISRHSCPVGGGGADDVTLFNASFPVAGKLLYSFYQSIVTKAGTITIRDTAGGGGAAVGLAQSTNNAATEAATGTGNGIALNGSAFARRTDSTSSGSIMCIWLAT